MQLAEGLGFGVWGVEGLGLSQSWVQFLGFSALALGFRV